MPNKPARKKTTTKSASRVRTKSTQNWLDDYLRQRQAFYQRHPHIRVLLGIFIVVFAMAIGVLLYNKNLVYIGLSLDQYGVSYPYPEPQLDSQPGIFQRLK